jgi:hypothetical protein
MDYSKSTIYIDNELAKISILNDIMIGIYKTNTIDLDVAKKIIKLRIDACNHVAHPLLVDIRGVKSFSKEARDYIAKDGTALLSATAILINSPLTKVLANFYLKLSNPEVPTRLFTNFDEAYNWLIPHKTKVA